MKGLQPLFLGIFGIFAFSWFGMTVVPNLQIGSLNPQTDEDGTDIYPMPQSGMVARGARVYAANGCVYCHSQQVRPEYGGSDLERKWGVRRSAPRDYIFESIVFLGKTRIGPDLANVGHPAALQEEKAATAVPAPAATPAAAEPAAAAAATVATSPRCRHPGAGGAGFARRFDFGRNPYWSDRDPCLSASPIWLESTASGEPLPDTAAWHHRHLYNPRSISEDSNMPAYRFLYLKRRVSGAASPDSLNFAGDSDERPPIGWEIVPSYDAKCLVAYIMSRDQSHPLKEAKSPVTIAPAPAKEAQK